MAKVIITIEDTENDNVRVETELSPVIERAEDITAAQELGLMLTDIAAKVLRAEVSVNADD